MPHNVAITEEQELAFEGGGGLAERSIRQREQAYEEFAYFVEHQLGESISEAFKDDPDKLSKLFSLYFWTMKVKTRVHKIN